MFKISDTKRAWLKEQIEKLTHSGVSKADIARSLNILPQQLNNILNGSRGVSDDFLDTFIKTFNLNQIDLYSKLLPDPDADSIYKRIIQVFNDEQITVSSFIKSHSHFKHIFENALHWDDPKTAKGWADLVVACYPRYSINWILTGDGPMLKEDGVNIQPNHTFALSTDRKVQVQDIPLYDLSATAGIMAIFNDLSITPEDYLRVPNLPPVDGAIYVRGESMTPLLKSGDIIIYKKLALSLDSILWGQIYLLSFDAGGDTFTVVKYIQKSDDPERIRLVSHNSHFEPKDIPLSSIRALAIVKASITFHTIE
jgi:phage repressor protein C with HTH and peptisase S24 domain